MKNHLRSVGGYPNFDPEVRPGNGKRRGQTGDNSGL